MDKYLRSEAIVIKRTNYSDADRFITLFTKEYGKVSCLARGVRKMSSRKRPALEPMSLIQASFVRGKNSGLILTEATLKQTFMNVRKTLPRLTQAVQILEITDRLIPEDEPNKEVYAQLLESLSLMDQYGFEKEGMLNAVKVMLDSLGFGYPEGSEINLKDHLESIIEKPLLAKKFMIARAW